MLPILLEYRDANNKEYIENIKLELPLYTTSEAKQLGLAEGNGKVGFFVVIAVVVAGLFAYRRWRKGKRRNNYFSFCHKILQ